MKAISLQVFYFVLAIVGLLGTLIYKLVKTASLLISMRTPHRHQSPMISSLLSLRS